MVIDNAAAVRHFRRHMNKAPNWIQNRMGPWKGLNRTEREEDIVTADWVPNRAAWRSKGLRGRRHAMEVL